MKLSECKMGVIVQLDDKVGMVVGITNNCWSGDLDIRGAIGRAIPLVQWSSDITPIGVHHNNLTLYKD